MLKHTLGYIYALFTFLLFTSTSVWAETDLTCANTVQDSLTAPWACPKLYGNETKMTAILSDVDVESAKYTCEYRYADSAQMATACTYLSKTYKDSLAKTREKIRKDLVEAITNDRYGNILDFNSDYYADTLGASAFSITGLNAEMPALYRTLLAEKKLVKNIHGRIKNIIFNGSNGKIFGQSDGLKKYINIVEEANGRVAELYQYLDPNGRTKIQNPMDALKQSYKSLLSLILLKEEQTEI